MTTKPRKKITDQAFKYVPAVKTDVAATFRRVRRELDGIKAEQEVKVKQLPRKDRKP